MSRITSKYCQGCTDRKVGCHIKCFAYNVDLARQKLVKERNEADKLAHMQFVGYSLDRSERERRRHGK